MGLRPLRQPNSAGRKLVTTMNIMRIYRLEAEDGGGPFFTPDAVCRTYPDIVFDRGELHAFRNMEDFKSNPSYSCFLSDPAYDMYEYSVAACEVRPSGEIRFWPDDVVSKRKVTM